MVWYLLSSWRAKMRARGLVYQLSVTQTTFFGMPDVGSAKGEWVEHGVECHEIRDGSLP